MEDEQWVEPFKLDVLPRLQWFENFGYSGEVSFISAGLFFGQYCSQYTAREVAATSLGANSNNSDVPSQCEESSRLLLETNAESAARACNLNTESWQALALSNPDAARCSLDFLQWVKGHVLLGHPVAIGVYKNRHLFDEEPSESNATATSRNHVRDYDHVALVYGVSASYTTPRMTQKQQCEKDIFYLLDHGLWGKDKKNPPFHFSHTAIHFQATRKQADAKNGKIKCSQSHSFLYFVLFVLLSVYFLILLIL